jgi:hypothetical protein
VFVVLGGLFPSVIVIQHSGQADIVEEVFQRLCVPTQLGTLTRGPQTIKHCQVLKQDVNAMSVVALEVEHWEEC